MAVRARRVQRDIKPANVDVVLVEGRPDPVATARLVALLIEMLDASASPGITKKGRQIGDLF